MGKAWSAAGLGAEGSDLLAYLGPGSYGEANVYAVKHPTPMVLNGSRRLLCSQPCKGGVDAVARPFPPLRAPDDHSKDRTVHIHQHDVPTR